MIDERGNDWREYAPEGTEVYVWFMPDDRACDEPDILYVGLGADGSERDRQTWGRKDGKGAQPIALSELRGRFMHPAVQIPYCQPTASAVSDADRRDAELNRKCELRRQPLWIRLREWWIDHFGARYPNRFCD